MLDYEEELKKFQPSLEVQDIEEAVYQEDLTDMSDILREMIEQTNKKILRKDTRSIWSIHKNWCTSRITGIMTGLNGQR